MVFSKNFVNKNQKIGVPQGTASNKIWQKKVGEMLKEEKPVKEFEERVIEVNRTSKKTKGGNRFGFSALVVVGDRKGKIGIGLGRASEVGQAIRKGATRAQKRSFTFQLVGLAKTIAHPSKIKKGAVEIILRPAPEGTGVRAGGPLRPVLEAAGVENITGKILGSKNKKGNVYALIEGLKALKQLK